MAEIKKIKPQPGYQMDSLSSSADILIGGGAAGVGKSFSLLLEPLRHISVPNFGGVIFRRTSPQIRAEGGLWDASSKLYSMLGNAKSRESTLEWIFNTNVKIKFSHLEYEKNKFDWMGSEVPFIGFDELTHFSKSMFFYLLTRNRSTCGVRPYVRCTCNPDPDSWVADLISWWIGEDGFPISEREGILRWFLRDNDNYVWGFTKQEVYEKASHIIDPVIEGSGGEIQLEDILKSLTFISGSIYDNKELLKVDPSYVGNLLSQDSETQQQLLHGNWKVKVSDIDIYDYYKFRDVFNNTKAESGTKYITTDIAMKGSDKLIVFVWDNKILIDFTVLLKSKGDEVIAAINTMADKHGVSNSNIIFDNDGVGQFVDGFIEGAREFNNGSRTLNDENYNHLKSQCYFHSGDAVFRGEYSIPDEVGNRMYDDKMTLKQRFMYERKAIKRDKPDHDGKLRVLPKQEMKVFINNESPDVMDAFMMREWFEIKAFKRLFDQKYIYNIVASLKEPILVGELKGDESIGEDSLNNIRFKETEEGLLKLWSKPNDPPIPENKLMEHRYCVFVRLGGRNKNSNYSVISVFDRYWLSSEGGSPERVATWRGRMDQDFVAWKATQIAKYFNEALLAFEISNSKEGRASEGLHHLTLLDQVSDHYENLYTDVDPEQVIEGAPRRWGFTTSMDSISMLTNNYNALLRDGKYVERDKMVKKQAECFEVKEDGSYGAIDGQYDGLLKTTMGALWLATSYMEKPYLIDKVRKRKYIPPNTKRSMANI